MADDESIEINETALPGIGLRHDFMTVKGQRIGVVSHRTGRRDILVYDRDDPDACASSLTLSPEEADTVAEFLGTHRVTERLATLSDQVSSLRTHKVRITAGSPFEGHPLGDAKVRTRTGASIVAVLRDQEAIASPTPDFTLEGGDVLIVVGTDDALASVDQIFAG